MTDSPYGKNIYLIKTVDNFKRTEVFAMDSQGNLNKLGEDDVVVKGYGITLQPFTKIVFDSYVAWYVAKSLALSATEKENLIEAGLPSVIKKLEYAVAHIYDEDTEEYKTIFSKPRSYLYAGETQQQKLVNLSAESIILGGFPLLATVKTDFDASVKEYSDAITGSSDAQTTMTKASNTMEKARVSWCVEALGITGLLMNNFKETPEVIDTIFKLGIFDARQSHIDPDKDADVFGIPKASVLCANMVFDPTKWYQLHNSGVVVLRAGSASNPDVLLLPDALTFQIDETKIVSGTELGSLLNRYLLIINDDLTLAGEMKIKEVPAP